MSKVDISRLKSWLATSGLQKQNAPLHQVISALIDNTNQLNSLVASGSLSGDTIENITNITQILGLGGSGDGDGEGSIGPPGITGPQGIQGIQGLAGLAGLIGPPGLDGEDGEDSYLSLITTSTPSGTSDHNSLSGLQGGTAGEYYHLTSAEYIGSGTGVFARVNSPVFVTPALGTPSSGVATNLTGIAAGLTAGKATILETARTIAGVSFDGSVNISIASTNLSDTANLARLNASNVFSLINPLITAAESWIGPSSTAGIYFKSGNVGIGTITPGIDFAGGTGDYTGALEISPSGNRAALLLGGTIETQVVFGDSGNAANFRKVGIGFDAGLFSLYRILDANIGRSGTAAENYLNINTTTGNIGIGTTGPNAPLEINGNSSNANNSLFITTDTYTHLSAGTLLRLGHGATSGNTYSVIDSLGAGGTSIAALVLNQGGGNVGIGTTSPNVKLHLNNSGSVSTRLQLTNATSGFSASDGFQLQQEGNETYIWNYENSNMRFGTNNIGCMIILPSSNVGIGTTSPSAKTDIDQSSTTAALPVLRLDQADISEEMIEFETTIGVGNAIEAVGTKALTTTHFIKITIPGALTRYIPCGTIA